MGTHGPRTCSDRRSRGRLFPNALCPHRLDRRREHVLPLAMSMGGRRLGRRRPPDLLQWATQASQQASRPDKAWARRALTDQYATRFEARRSRSALQVRCKTLAGHSTPSASAVNAEVADSEPVLTLARALVGALPKSTTAATAS